MAEYISREAAFVTLTACYHHTKDIQHRMLRWVLGKVPAADVAEERHGRWTHERLASTTGGTYPAIRCSVCEVAVPIFDSFPYCPNCGAKMDESEGDGNG